MPVEYNAPRALGSYHASPCNLAAELQHGSALPVSCFDGCTTLQIIFDAISYVLRQFDFQTLQALIFTANIKA